MTPLALLALLSAPPAHAETFYSPPSITLHSTTTLYADVWDTEYISWVGQGQLTAFAPSGTRHDITSSVPLLSDETGVWTFYLGESQTSSWDLAIREGSTGTKVEGRVFSDTWSIGTTSGGAFYQTFYVPVPINAERVDYSASEGRLIKIDLQGLEGSTIRILANTEGLPTTPFQSAPATADNIPDPTLRLYLSRPQIVGAIVGVYPAPPKDSLVADFADDTCDLVILDQQGADLSFSTGLIGLSTFICDIDGDGRGDASGRDGDVIGGVAAAPGDMYWSWAGAASTAGEWVEPGSYTCEGSVMVGGIHALIQGALVADPGVRLFDVIDGTAENTNLYWNDTAVEDGVLLQSGDMPLLTSGTDVFTSTFEDASIANKTAHGWGNRDATSSRGLSGWIDTWNPGTVYSMGAVEVIVLDGEQDVDRDGLASDDECFDHDTDPLDADTDAGGIDDGQEIKNGTDPLDPADDIPTDDTGVPDKSEDSLGDLLGDFGGGALRCTTVAAPTAAPLRALLFPALLAAGAVLRRRRRARPGVPTC